MNTEQFVLVRKEDKSAATIAATSALSTELSHLAEAKTPVLVLVSGGSALQLLNDIQESGLTPQVTLGVLDERYSMDPQINNFLQLKQTTLYSKALAQGCHFIDTSVQAAESQEDLRARFESALQQWKDANPSGHIVITQGMGPDGHTSGVLPFPEDPEKFAQLFLNPSVWVATYDATGKNQYPLRVTTTLSFLQRVDISIMFICGEDKRAALSFVLANEGILAQTPARIARDMQQVTIFTDIQ